MIPDSLLLNIDIDAIIKFVFFNNDAIEKRVSIDSENKILIGNGYIIQRLNLMNGQIEEVWNGQEVIREITKMRSHSNKMICLTRENSHQLLIIDQKNKHHHWTQAVFNENAQNVSIQDFDSDGHFIVGSRHFDFQNFWIWNSEGHFLTRMYSLNPGWGPGDKATYVNPVIKCWKGKLFIIKQSGELEIYDLTTYHRVSFQNWIDQRIRFISNADHLCILHPLGLSKVQITEENQIEIHDILNLDIGENVFHPFREGDQTKAWLIKQCLSKNGIQEFVCETVHTRRFIVGQILDRSSTPLNPKTYQIDLMVKEIINPSKIMPGFSDGFPRSLVSRVSRCLKFGWHLIKRIYPFVWKALSVFIILMLLNK